MTAIASAQVKVDERREVSANEVIEIVNIAGSVKVIGTQATELHVTGTIDELHKLEIRRRDNRTKVEVVYPKESSGDANIEVQVPRGCRVMVSTISADAEVKGVSGDIKVQTVSGSAKIPEGGATLDVNTVSGDLDVGASSSKTSVKSVSGDIRIQGASGMVRGETVSGTITITGTGISEAWFTSVSGDIIFDGKLGDNGKLSISNHSGNTVLSLPSDLSAQVLLTASTGDIESSFSGSSSEKLLSKRLEFTLGAGNGQIKVQSFSGNIKVKKR